MKKIIMAITAMLLTGSMLAACVNEGGVTPTPETTPTDEATAETTAPATEETTPTPTPTPVVADPAVLLKDKKAFFFGDSICAAAVYDESGSRYGWPGRIKDAYGLKEARNCGGDGAAISDKGPTTPPLKIHDQVVNNKSNNVDFVILEGGVNDAWANVAVGQMVDKPASETTMADLDCNTFAGGLERILSIAKKQYPNAKIGYIIMFKLRDKLTIGRLSDMDEYVEMTKKICDKYDVPYLNLYEDKAFAANFMVFTNRCVVDGIHPNSRGYDLLAPKIAQFMADIAVK